VFFGTHMGYISGKGQQQQQQFPTVKVGETVLPEWS